MSTEEEKIKRLLDKHKALSPDDIKQTLKDADTARGKYSKNIEEVESNLVGFLQKEDPIVDPATGKAIAWIRQVPIKELQSYGMEFKSAFEGKTEAEVGKLLATDPELAVKQFEVIARVVSNPKHDAKWWSEHATMDFIKLFETTFQESLSRVIKDASFLSEQTMDSV